MRRGLVRNSRYSPGNMDAESLERLFVGRDSAMADVLERVVVSVGKGKEKHFLLLVGPRGCGKTHFVVLARHRLEVMLASKGLTADVEVAFLNEEEWGVASYLDFLVRVLRALIRDDNGLEKVVATIHEMFAKTPNETEAFAEAAIIAHVKERTLLLICENLVDLFEGLGEEGQRRWRAFIQETGFWTILATTPALFAAITLQEHPFYGFFTLRELRQLDYEGANELLLKKALHDGQRELAEFLRTPVGRARIRAVHHLAAGNHRAYVLLYDFLDMKSLDDLIKPFMHMVDDLTPYYQDKMRQLPPAQRKIVEFLCQKAEPVPVKEIATRCLMSQQTAAKQLGELMLAGFIRKSPIGRQTLCEIAEPLMRICIEVKDNRTEHFRLFVEFLRHWFSSRELEHHISVLEGSDHVDFDRVHFEEALRCSKLSHQEPFLSALRSEGVRCREKRDYVGLAGIYQKLVGETGEPPEYYWYTYALIRRGQAREAVHIGQEAVAKFPIDPFLHFNLAQAHWQLGQYSEVVRDVGHAIERNPSEVSYHCLRAAALVRLEKYPDAVAAARQALQLDPKHLHSYEQIIEALVSSNRLDEAESEADELERRYPSVPKALTIVADYHYSRKNYRHALEVLNKALGLEAEYVDARYSRGLIHFELAEYVTARDDLKFVVSRRPNSVGALCRLSDTLMCLKDYPEAVTVARQLIKADPDHQHAYIVLGAALTKCGTAQEGAEVLGQLLHRGRIQDLRVAAAIAVKAEEWATARKLVNRAIELGPQDAKLKVRILHLELLVAVSGQEFWVPALRKELNRHQLDEILEESKEFAQVVATALAKSVRRSGPTHLVDAVSALRDFVSPVLEKGYLGEILTFFLSQVLEGIHGPLEQWEQVLRRLGEDLADLTDCGIPLAILTAAVRYTKTGDERFLLRLPLEQRQLIQGVLEHSRAAR